MRVLFISLVFSTVAPDAFALSIETVPIGQVGNPADTNAWGTYGAVNYPYRIAATEVTNAQYVEFLNAIASTDTFGVYASEMDFDPRGGIVRFGVPGGYTYAVKPDAVGLGPANSDYKYADKPVVFVNVVGAFRFANWLHNGQPSGFQDATTTEDGAYSFPLSTDTTRILGAKWFLPSQDEWYKAAYYDPMTATYNLYPTGTSSPPNNNLPESDTGNSANFISNGMFTTGNELYPLTDVGAYAKSKSAYGTFDQGGNVAEVNETAITGSLSGLRGSSWFDVVNRLRSDEIVDFYNHNKREYIGFRVATITPEPQSAVLAVICLILSSQRRRMHSSSPSRRESVRQI